MGDPVVHFEVMALDGARLRDFYAGLFGWTVDADNPMGYGVVSHAENHSTGGVGIGGGIFGDMPAGQDGVTVYVAVEDVETTLRRATELGGTRLAGPQAVEGGTTFGHLTDPEGHWIGLFEKAGLGTPVRPAADTPAAGAPVVHFEIVGRDMATLSGFYSELFGWQIHATGPAYGVVSRERNVGSGEAGIGGGIMALPEDVAVDYPGHVTFYVEVPDVAAAMSRVEGLGGQRMVGPESLPDGGPVIGQIADPEGHVIGLVQAGTL